MKYDHLGEIDYDGSQLHHAFAYEKAGILGPSIVSFIGKAEVKDHLVDLEDSISNDFIKSKSMFHFIIEIPDASIRETVVWQRFFMTILAERLRNVCCPLNSDVKIIVEGDDIMINGAKGISTDWKKLSVSIATLSRFGGLIHTGLNIEVGEGCPVPAIGLIEIPYSTIGTLHEVAQEFAEEYIDIIRATYKVKEV